MMENDDFTVGHLYKFDELQDFYCGEVWPMYKTLWIEEVDDSDEEE